MQLPQPLSNVHWCAHRKDFPETIKAYESIYFPGNGFISGRTILKPVPTLSLTMAERLRPEDNADGREELEDLVDHLSG